MDGERDDSEEETSVEKIGRRQHGALIMLREAGGETDERKEYWKKKASLVKETLITLPLAK